MICQVMESEQMSMPICTLNWTNARIKNLHEMDTIVFYKGFKFSQSGYLTKTKREIIYIFI